MNADFSKITSLLEGVDMIRRGEVADHLIKDCSMSTDDAFDLIDLAIEKEAVSEFTIKKPEGKLRSFIVPAGTAVVIRRGTRKS